jgi:iron(II)-dependent oxidoreductase
VGLSLTGDLAAVLSEARARTLSVLDTVPLPEQSRQISPLMSPLCWDLGHIAHFEELWLLRRVAGAEPTDPRFDDIYDAFEHPRAERPRLDLLDPVRAREFAADVRKRVLDVLASIDLDASDPLLADGFVYGMIAQHEHQHVETMLATLQLLPDFEHPLAHEAPDRRGVDAACDAGASEAEPGGAAEILVEGGPFIMGTDNVAWTYDNERPAHEVDIPAFWIDTTPVTNGAYLEFVDGGGYHDPAHWTDAGWAWRQEAGLEHPQFWIRNDGGWARVRFGRVEPLPLDDPVQHVCWFEADAFARFAGKRLPTEAEWEKAASWDPVRRDKRRFPWGDDPPTPARANLASGRWRPDAARSRRDGRSAWGCHQMLGDVWEWTASAFTGYPGFRAFPYREYSEVFFGTEYKVLRGGSWATHPVAIRTTFRNWDYPIRRQIFAGFRCARDA